MRRLSFTANRGGIVMRYSQELDMLNHVDLELSWTKTLIRSGMTLTRFYWRSYEVLLQDLVHDFEKFLARSWCNISTWLPKKEETKNTKSRFCYTALLRGLNLPHFLFKFVHLDSRQLSCKNVAFALIQFRACGFLRLFRLTTTSSSIVFNLYGDRLYMFL